MKKKVVVYGNCHTESIIGLLKSVPEFNSQYEIIPTLAIQNIKDPKYLKGKCFTECDLFIHQSIWTKNRYGEEYASIKLIERLKPDCKIIAIPNVYHLPLCFFPNYSSKPEFTNRMTTVFFRDEIIDKLILNHASPQSILYEYNKDNLFPADQLKQAFQIFMRKIEKREADWDIKVRDFIINNYTTHKLFHDPNHPTNYFFAYVVWKLLEIIDIKYNFDLLLNVDIRELDSFEMPICNSVKKHFNMTFENKEMRITGNKVRRNRKFDLSEYIKQYISMEWQNEDLPFFLRIGYFIRWVGYKILSKLSK